ncbi:MAG: peptide chain release factor N(5)-glutamine methyltransferase [Candidatus Dormibacteria bacterium]
MAISVTGSQADHASSSPRQEGPGPSLLEILRRSTGYLLGAGVPQPRLEAELILAHCLALSRLDLYLQFERPLQESELSRIRPLLRSRAEGRPLAYITGHREFFGLSFEVGEAVLIPRPETELLVELGLRAAGGGSIRCADLGCGSGCVGIALAVGLAGAVCDLVDLDPGAVDVARRNALLNQVQDRVTVLGGSWAEPLRERGRYHLIVSNPPYVTSAEWARLEPGVRDYEPSSALDAGPDGLRAYRELLPSIAAIASPHATVLLECDPRRIAAVQQLCEQLLPHDSSQVHLDLTGRPRVLQVNLG